MPRTPSRRRSAASRVATPWWAPLRRTNSAPWAERPVGIRGLVDPKNWDSEISPRKLGMYQSKMVMSCDFMPTKLVKDQEFNGFHMILAPNSIEMIKHVLLANQNDDDE